MKHLLIRGFMVERDYRNTIVNLVGKGVNTIVNYNHVFHCPIGYYSQIFDVIPFWCLHTVLPIHTILEHLILRVNIVEDCICINLMRRCEYNNLKIFVSFLEALHQIRS